MLINIVTSESLDVEDMTGHLALPFPMLCEREGTVRNNNEGMGSACGNRCKWSPLLVPNCILVCGACKKKSSNTKSNSGDRRGEWSLKVRARAWSIFPLCCFVITLPHRRLQKSRLRADPRGTLSRLDPFRKPKSWSSTHAPRPEDH